MWIKPDADADPNGGIIGWGDFTTATPLSYNAFTLNTLSGVSSDWGGSKLSGTSHLGSMADGNWHHVAVSFDGANQEVQRARMPGSKHVCSLHALVCLSSSFSRVRLHASTLVLFARLPP